MWKLLIYRWGIPRNGSFLSRVTYPLAKWDDPASRTSGVGGRNMYHIPITPCKPLIAGKHVKKANMFKTLCQPTKSWLGKDRIPLMDYDNPSILNSRKSSNRRWRHYLDKNILHLADTDNNHPVSLVHICSVSVLIPLPTIKHPIVWSQKIC